MAAPRRSPRLQERRREAAALMSQVPLPRLRGGACDDDSSSSSSGSSSSSSTTSSSSSSSSSLDRLAPPLARGRSLSPGRQRDTMALARIVWSQDIVDLLIDRLRTGAWSGYVTKQRKYKLKQLVAAHSWAVRRRRYNRWVARVIDDDAVAAASADDEEDSDDASEGSEEGSDDDLLVGRAADGSSDSRSERVLMVRSLTRRSDLVRADGSRLQLQQWFEIVPTDRIDDLLSSMWHMGGVQSLSTPKLYAAVVAKYVGVSHAAVSSFISRQEAAALSNANLVADQIVSPSLPEALNESWSGDLTFLDATIPSGSYTCFLTVIDALSRMAFTVPLRDKSAATLGAAYEELFRVNGAPRTLVQDSAVENMSSTLRLVAARYGVRRLRFTAPHVSQQNGLVEREHQTLKALLRRAGLDAMKKRRGGSVRTGASQSTHGRQARVELRDLQRGTSEVSGSRMRKPAELGPGMLANRSDTRPTLEQRGVSPLEAARTRLGLGRGAQGQSYRDGAGAVAGAGDRAGAGAVPSRGQGPLIVRRISAIVLVKGVVPPRLLYCVSYEGKDPSSDAFVPSTDFGGMTDAQLQAVLKKDQRNDPPVLFDLPFRGPADLDRRKPIPVATVLNEVETATKLNDGQPERGYPLDADEGEDENVEETAQARPKGTLVLRPRAEEEEEEERPRGRGRATPPGRESGQRR
jgi:transposase InsO family protein